MSLPTAQRPSARRIVCGVDGSEQARHAASAALRLAERLGAQLTLVHVTPTGAWLRRQLPHGVDPAPSRARANSPSPRPRLRSTPCRPTSPQQAWSARCGSASLPRCSPRSLPTRRRVDRGRVARPRGLALRRLGLRVQRRRAARAVPGDDRAGARGGGSHRRVTVPAVVRLHLADDAERAGPYLSRLDAERRRDVSDPDPREQHADDREILGVQSGRGCLDELRGRATAPASPRRRRRRWRRAALRRDRSWRRSRRPGRASQAPRRCRPRRRSRARRRAGCGRCLRRKQALRPSPRVRA